MKITIFAQASSLIIDIQEILNVFRPLANTDATSTNREIVCGKSSSEQEPSTSKHI